MKNITKFLNNYLKDFKINKNLLFKSLTSLSGALLKIFLLNRLQNMKYFKTISILLRVIVKWSAFSSILTILYSIVCSISGFKYDATFFISLLSAFWVIITELSFDSVFNVWDYILDNYNKLLAKIELRLSKSPENQGKIKQIRELWPSVKRDEINYNPEEVRAQYLEKEMERARAERELRERDKYLPKNTEGGYLDKLKYRDIFKIVLLAGAFVSTLAVGYHFLEQVKSTLGILVDIKDKVNEFFNIKKLISKLIPDSVKGLFTNWWPFGGNTPSTTTPADPVLVPTGQKSMWERVKGWFSGNKAVPAEILETTTPPEEAVRKNFIQIGLDYLTRSRNDEGFKGPEDLEKEKEKMLQSLGLGSIAETTTSAAASTSAAETDEIAVVDLEMTYPKTRKYLHVIRERLVNHFGIKSSATNAEIKDIIYYIKCSNRSEQELVAIFVTAYEAIEKGRISKTIIDRIEKTAKKTAWLTNAVPGDRSDSSGGASVYFREDTSSPRQMPGALKSPLARVTKAEEDEDEADISDINMFIFILPKAANIIRKLLPYIPTIILFAKILVLNIPVDYLKIIFNKIRYYFNNKWNNVKTSFKNINNTPNDIFILFIMLIIYITMIFHLK
uniref:hypothetical protein n=1 Tax=Inonotus hispidus TaxID=40469 RepID=UPI002182496D|nr:hypothetical protein N4M07_mgp065 [Inonotus hispidus]UVF37987.1 hypothetical protein [Inonotus hispidus]